MKIIVITVTVSKSLEDEGYWTEIKDTMITLLDKAYNGTKGKNIKIALNINVDGKKIPFTSTEKVDSKIWKNQFLRCQNETLQRVTMAINLDSF